MMEICFLCDKEYKIKDSISILPDVLCSKECEQHFL